MTEAGLEHDRMVDAAIAALTADRDHGATDLARQALDILELATSRSPGGEGTDAYLDGVGARIIRARPTMAAVKNAVASVMSEAPFAHPGEGKAACLQAHAWIDHAAKATIEKAAVMILDGATILTCSYSGTVLEACVSACAAGKRVKVIALRSTVGEIAYGERMAGSLAAHGIDVHVRPDTVSASDLGPLTMALIGADRVCPDGSLVNGVPSLVLAEHAHDVVPLWVAAESFKLDDAEEVEDGFQRVPARLVTGYVTDRGAVQPSQVWRLRSTR